MPKMIKLVTTFFLATIYGAQYPANAQRPGVVISESQAREIIIEYTSRPKSLLEQVLNYTRDASETGSFYPTDNSNVSGSFWISGLNEHKCIMTLVHVGRDPDTTAPYNTRQFLLLFREKIDIRTLNQTGFRIQGPIRDSILGAVYRLGDERQSIRGSGSAVMERLQNAWRLAFQECPGVRSAF
jgi:hypothetical protein